MKKFLSVVVMGVALVASNAFAQDAAQQSVSLPAQQGVNSFDAAMKAGPCAAVKLTDAQKAQIKTAMTNFKAANTPLLAAVKAARAAFSANVADSKADLATAQTTTAALATAQAAEQSARLTLKTEILFSVLTPDQRKPALACERLIQRRMAAHRHHHGHHGGKPSGTQQQANNN
jgi:hypothetical protein